MSDAEETSLIDSVDFDSLTGPGNDAFHDQAETAKSAKGKKKFSKEKGVSPAEQAIDGGVIEEPPKMTSPEWHDYVIRQLEEDEKDADGNPYVHGLRRITELVIGPILESTARVVQAPMFVESIGKITHPTTVEYTLRILNTVTPEGIEPYEMVYTDCADVFEGNTDPEFLRFPSAMAATRAEGRCYKKALRLKRVAASEELTSVPLEEAGINGEITPTQINFIDMLCRRLKVDAMKYINSGKKKYAKIEEVTYVTAKKMTEHLSTLTNDPSMVPDDIKGYKIDWMMQ